MDKKQELIEKIKKLTQFPHKERSQNYQSYWIGGDTISGSRDTYKRVEIMGIDKGLAGKSLLDLGCNLGAICLECADSQGSHPIMGVDYEKDYIECANELAKYNGFGGVVTFEVMDLTKTKECADRFKQFFGKPVDMVLALSLYKHIKGKMFELLDSFEWRELIIESNNAPQKEATPHCVEIINHMKKRGWNYKFIGMTNDRSPRCLWRVSK